MLTLRFWVDEDRMMVPLMLRNKISVLMLIPPMFTAINLNCWDEFSNTNIKNPVSLVLSAKKHFTLLLWNYSEKVVISYIQEMRVCTRTCLQARCTFVWFCFIKHYFPLLGVKAQYLRLTGLKTFKVRKKTKYHFYIPFWSLSQIAAGASLQIKYCHTCTPDGMRSVMLWNFRSASLLAHYVQPDDIPQYTRGS